MGISQRMTSALLPLAIPLVALATEPATTSTHLAPAADHTRRNIDHGAVLERLDRHAGGNNPHKRHRRGAEIGLATLHKLYGAVIASADEALILQPLEVEVSGGRRLHPDMQSYILQGRSIAVLGNIIAKKFKSLTLNWG